MRRIHFVPALLVALVMVVLAAPAAAVQTDLTIFIDFDNDPGTGCTDPASGFAGYDQRVVTTVETTTGPNAAEVTQIEGFDCSNAQIFLDTTNHPVGIGNGTLGLNVIETYWPIAALLPPPTNPCHGASHAECLRLGVFAQNANGGTDTLFTTDGTPTGPPILFLLGGVAEIPTVSEWGLLILSLLLAGTAAFKLRRRPLRALLTILLVLAGGGVAYAIVFDLDGNTLHEWPIAFRVAFDPSATDDGDDIAALYARRDQPSARVYFRIDASLVFNTAPVVTTTPGVTAFTEDGGAVVVDGGVTVTDLDSPNLASATVTITNPQDGALETLAAGACAGLTVTPGLNSLSITGVQPPAAYQSCLQSVTFNDTSNTPGTTPRVIAFVANDGIVNSAPGNKTVSVGPINDPPVVVTTDGDTAFTEDGGPVVVDGGVTVSDVDNANLASATVTITNPQDGALEVLAATACAGLTVTPGLNTLGITGSQPLATYQSCLQSVTFDDTSNNPSTTPRVLSFVVNDGTISSAAANKTVTVVPAPDAPVVITTAPATTSFTEGDGPVVVDGGVTVTDPDDPNLASATVTITNVQDVGFEALAATACGAFTVGGSGTPTLTITGSQPLATYQTCLQSVTYDNTDQDPGTTPRVISFVANDGSFSSAPGNKTVTVTPVNDAPVVTTTAGTTAFTEGDGPVVVDAGVTVSDVDNANLASATVTITNPQDGAAEVLAATACGGLTVTPGLNSLSIMGSLPLATYQTCLQSVTYDNTDQDPGTTSRVISFVANDGTASSAAADKTVTVTVVDNAPVVLTTAGNTAFTEDGPAVVVDAGVTVTDPDSANLLSATVTITNPQDGALEVLAATACAGLTVTPGLNTLGISGSQPPATYQTCLQSVTYNNTDQDPGTTPRVISFVANDGTTSSAAANKTVTVGAINDAPTVTTTAGNTAFTEGDPAVVVDGGVTVADVDNANLASATVSITNVQDVGFESLAATACGPLVVGGSGTPTLTLTGSQPLATYQTCLQSVTYNDTDQDPSTVARTISFVVNDGALSSTPATKTVTVAAVNDAPVVLTTGGTTSFTEGAGAVVVDSGVTVTDDDSLNLASATVTVTNVQDVGFEALAATACGALVVGGSGTPTLTITGSQPPATYQACLQSVTYDNTDLDPGTTPRVISFVANDGALSSTPATKTVTVTAVNSAPVVTTTAGTTPFVEDGGPVAVDSGVTVTDVDSTNLASATATITNPLDGALETMNATACAGLTVTPGLNSVSITGSQPPATYQTCLQSVTYDNASQNPNTTPRVISFVANDGAASSTPATKTVTVAGAPDAPVVTTTAGNTAFTEDGPAVVVDSGVTVVDFDSGTLASALVTITNPQDGALETMNATACAGLTVTPGLNNVSITGVQPPATYQTCLQSVTYDNTSQNPGTTARVISFVANDGALSSTPANKTVTVAPLNDAPTVSTAAGVTAFVEDAGAVIIDPGVTVADVDSPNLASATVTITNPFDGASETLAATACAGLTVTPGLNTLGITGSQPLATYQTCLQSATYNNSSNNPNNTTRVISFVVNDGALSSAPANKSVSVQAVNDAPVVTTTPGSTAFTEDGPAVVVDSGVTVTDVDNTNLASATVTITNPQDGALETLAATACAGLTVTPGLNSVSITGSGTLGTYQTCMQSVTYNNTDQDPGTTPRVVAFVANDGTTSSAPANKTVTVAAVNDAPTVTTTGGVTSFTEDAGAVVVDGGVNVADVDNANLASATVSITNVQDAGLEGLAATACGALVIGGSGTPTLTITGSQTLAVYQTCLQSVTYNNTDQDPTAAPNRIVSFVVSDGALSSTPATKQVSVTPVNDAPSCSVNPVLYATAGNTQLEVAGAALAGVAEVTDPQSLLTKGAPTDPDGPGPFVVVPVSGNVGGGDWVINSNGSFTFVPNAGFTGTASRTFQVSDQGAPAGLGTCTVNVNVTDVVWYVRDVVDANNAAGGDGRSNNAFEALGSAQAPSTPDDYIYVFEGNTATTPQVGGFTMKNGQKLWGQGIALSIPSYPGLVAATNQARVRTTTASTDVVIVPATAGNMQNVEIRGLDLQATGATSNAVDVTSSGANLVGVTISNNNVRGATSEGVDLNNASTGAFTATVSNNTITSTGTGIDARTSAAGIMTVTASTDTFTIGAGNGFDARTLAGGGALRVALDSAVVTATGNGIVVDGAAAGTTTITSFANNSVNGNTTGTGISVTTAIFDGTPGGTFQNVNAGTTVVGASGNGVGGPGVLFNSAAGDITFGDFDVFADGGAGFSATGTTAYTGSAGLQVTMPAVGANVAAITGPAVSVNTVSGSLTFSSVSTTATTTTGISLFNFTDGSTAAIFSAPSGGNITSAAGAVGPLFNVNGGNAQITFGGNITYTSGNGFVVGIASWTGDDASDDILLSGAIVSGQASGPTDGAGILVNANSHTAAGHTITFSGGMNIFTTGSAGTDEAFAATANNANVRLHVTGTNILQSTSATALRVTNTTIGPSHITFRSVSSGNGTAAADPVNGIVINNTGTLGHLAITGNAGTCSSLATCTGGAIQNMTGTGVLLTSTTGPTIDRLGIQNTVGSGVDGTTTNGFTFTNGFIDNSGTGLGAETSSIAFNDTAAGTENNLSGAVTITGNTLTTAYYHGIDIFNFSGTISDAALSSNTITSTNSTVTSKGTGIRLVAFGSAGGVANVTRATIANNIISNFPSANGILASGGNGNLAGPAGIFGVAASGSDIINITGNRVAGFSAANRMGAFGIAATVNGRGQGNFNISNNGTVANPMTNFIGQAITNSSLGFANVTTTINNNRIVANNQAGAPGIGAGTSQTASSAENPALTVTITNNNISQTDGNGILVTARDASGSVRAKIQNNTVAAPLAGNRNGIRVDAGNAVSLNDTVCLNISGNTTAGVGLSPEGIGVRKQGTVAATNNFAIHGFATSPATQAQTVAYISGQNPGSASGTLIISGDNFNSPTCSFP